MSIRDFKSGYTIINGTTNEHIYVEQLKQDLVVQHEMSVNDILLMESILGELWNNNTVTIIRTYGKSE